MRNFFLKENACCFHKIPCAPIFNTLGCTDFYAILRRYLRVIAAIRRDLYGHFTQLLRSPRECIFAVNMPRALQNPRAHSHGRALGPEKQIKSAIITVRESPAANGYHGV
ncbi:hypothetical protein [Paraburkholderia bannensis]|uniref:hypothetical protein n=1 Tax=Paraburkholderia bannensis TaxID=765414 RepID=UPI002AC33C07|nr:hypothetical protein [Paraburkholderia bannensis]